MEPAILSRELVAGRFQVEEFRTRFGNVVWMVFDMENIERATALPAWIREADTREAAIKGLE